MGRKDLVMRNQRRFSPELKRSLIEELLSQTSTPAQICRRHNISSGLLYYWKRQYARGKFGNEPTKEAALADRVEQLERLVGQLTRYNPGTWVTFYSRDIGNTFLRALGLPGSKESKGGVSS